MDFEEINFEDLISYLDIKLILVFGSRLTKISNSFDLSDLDILVVSDDFEKMLRFKRRMFVMSFFPTIKVDPICVSQKEYALMLKRGTFFTNEIIKTGRIIYGRQNTKIAF